MSECPKRYTWICLTPFLILLAIGVLFTITSSTPPHSPALTLFAYLTVFLAVWGVMNWLFDRRRR